MKRKIIHLLLIKNYPDMSINTTLCGKVQWQGGKGSEGGGNNITLEKKEVTCKLCLKRLKTSDNAGDLAK